MKSFSNVEAGILQLNFTQFFHRACSTKWSDWAPKNPSTCSLHPRCRCWWRHGKMAAAAVSRCMLGETPVWRKYRAGPLVDSDKTTATGNARCSAHAQSRTVSRRFGIGRRLRSGRRKCSTRMRRSFARRSRDIRSHRRDREPGYGYTTRCPLLSILK